MNEKVKNTLQKVLDAKKQKEKAVRYELHSAEEKKQIHCKLRGQLTHNAELVSCQRGEHNTTEGVCTFGTGRRWRDSDRNSIHAFEETAQRVSSERASRVHD
mgnify:CR=1 FL=1